MFSRSFPILLCVSCELFYHHLFFVFCCFFSLFDKGQLEATVSEKHRKIQIFNLLSQKSIKGNILNKEPTCDPTVLPQRSFTCHCSFFCQYQLRYISFLHFFHFLLTSRFMQGQNDLINLLDRLIELPLCGCMSQLVGPHQTVESRSQLLTVLLIGCYLQIIKPPDEGALNVFLFIQMFSFGKCACTVLTWKFGDLGISLQQSFTCDVVFGIYSVSLCHIFGAGAQ